MLGGRRFAYAKKDGYVLSADADFVITGIVQKGIKKPEGPFGDHLGYYSLQHDFPVMKVENVYHRKNPLWHFTVVGRPPQEDSSFGYLIHQLVKQLTPQEFPGIQSINAVDAAGVHPLLLAVGSERYMPFRDKKPEEILAQANRILGSGQTSLAKFLLITGPDPNESVSAKDIPAFFRYLLERIDWRRDLHFYTKTTIDTLDYSGEDWNAGSKVVWAARGKPLRTLSQELPQNLDLPPGFSDPSFALPGILMVKAPPFQGAEAYAQAEAFCESVAPYNWEGIPLIVLTDDSKFAAATLNNFLWVSFTRANPSRDLHGVRSFVQHKHWGCEGPLVIDARIKPHHAPVLVEDSRVKASVDKFFAAGGELHGMG
jgi:4-hydroxy-3-polyprenylbenzoate decarboxylase